MTTLSPSRLSAREMLNKVPEVTLYFWVIKVLCTTVGETASDYLSTNVGLGLTKTTYITSALLIATLVVQFRARRYIPPVYWLGIVLISVVGTQITDNLTDNHGVSLVTTTSIFSIVLAGVFLAWYASERTLSIHTIFTTRREAFYWLTVLFTFALGTAAGDLAAERLALGYALSAVMFAGVIGLVTLAHYRFNLGAVTAFWLAYILTRPLGASLGDFLSQARSSGGLGLGTTVTSFIFLGAIVAVVAYLTATRKDVSAPGAAEATIEGKAHILVVAHQTATTLELLAAIRGRAAQGPASFHLLVPNIAATRRDDGSRARTAPRRRRAASSRSRFRSSSRPRACPSTARSRYATTRWTPSRRPSEARVSTRSSSRPSHTASRAGSMSISRAASVRSGCP